MPESSSRMPYATHGVKGSDDDLSNNLDLLNLENGTDMSRNVGMTVPLIGTDMSRNVGMTVPLIGTDMSRNVGMTVPLNAAKYSRRKLIYSWSYFKPKPSKLRPNRNFYLKIGT